jgi:hypothetical protein
MRTYAHRLVSRRPLPVLLIVAAVVLGSALLMRFSSSAEIASGPILTWSDVRLGACFDMPAEELGGVAVRPCAYPHEDEVFFVGNIASSGVYPSKSELDAWLFSNCEPAFAAFIGRPLEASALDVGWHIPNTTAWRSGDRSALCWVYDIRDNARTGSLRNADR